MQVEEVERWLDLLYIAAQGAGLRREDTRKAVEVAAMLGEIERAIRRQARRSPIVLVDAAAGKAYLGLLAARLVLEPLGRPAEVITIEKDPRRVALSRKALERLQTPIVVECRTADVADPAAWPKQASLVTALHACGAAADAIIEGTVTSGARMLLLVPCCTSAAVPGASRALRESEAAGVPLPAPVRRRWIQARVDAQRTWRLEAAGYQVEVVEFVGATVTPHNLLWRARRVMEPVRMAAAQRALDLSPGIH
jgi:hypothetical protein